VARGGPLPTEVIGIFPPDVAEFAFVDLQQARSLVWFPQLQRKVLPDELRQFELFLASPGMDRDSHIEQLAWALVPASSESRSPHADTGSQEIVSVALGQFSPNSAAAYFKARQRAVVNVRNHVLYPLNGGSGAGGTLVWFVNSTVAVLGERPELERMIGINDNEEPSLLSNARLAGLISQANPHSVIWGALNASRANLEMQAILPGLAGFSQSQQLFSKVQAFTLEIAADRGTQSLFEVICASPDDANMFATLLQAALLYQTSRADQPNQDMTALLSRAKVAASTDRLDVTLALTNDQVVDLLQRNGLSRH
ncbi:MAG: hypothetical protein JO119_11240, partial [Acidobacteria bacterium]|nr:hypothetical protein [Acidobacteriota bacterium]